jgi:tetratricopeptide (TPR) repeat protein
LIRRQDGDLRFAMYETIHEFADERLAQDPEAAALRRRHAAYFEQQVMASKLRTAAARKPSLERFDRDVDNVRAALEWCAGPDGDPDLGSSLFGGLYYYWYFRGRISEGLQWSRRLQEAAERAGATGSLPRAWLLLATGILNFADGRWDEAGLALEEALRRFEAEGAEDEIAFTEATFGMVTLYSSAPEVRPRLEDAIRRFQALGDRWGETYARFFLSGALLSAGDLDGGARLIVESVQASRDLNDDWLLALSLSVFADYHVRLGQYEAALPLLDETFRRFEAVGDRWALSLPLISLGSALLQLGRVDEAESAFLRSGAVAQATGYADPLTATLTGLAAIALRRGELDRAANLAALASRLAAVGILHIWPNAAQRTRQWLAGLRPMIPADLLSAADGRYAGLAEPALRELARTPIEVLAAGKEAPES